MEEEIKPSEDPAAEDPGERKILIVDDAAMFRDLESLFLARSGEVMTACDAEEAWEILHRERPDVVVTDLLMPGMDGDELCRRIKADPDLKRTPVVVVTARNVGEQHERAVRAGADDVVEKPVNRVSLIQAVNNFLRLAVRGLVRVALETDVRIAGSEGEIWARSRNVSRGGMFVESERDLAPDSEVQLEFALPEMPGSLSPTAKVVWRRPANRSAVSGLGLQFLKLDREAARRLDEYVYEHAVLEDRPEGPRVAQR
jgi:uncharacterized protein (TIGR02266 family)